jgi:hypothetical protein
MIFKAAKYLMSVTAVELWLLMVVVAVVMHLALRQWGLLPHHLSKVPRYQATTDQHIHTLLQVLRSKDNRKDLNVYAT